MSMTLVNQELYQALRKADVPDDMALAAAKADQETNQRLSKIEAKQEVHDKLLWAVLAGTVGILLKLFIG